MSNPNPEITGVIKVEKLNVLRSLCGAKINEERKEGYTYLNPIEDDEEEEMDLNFDIKSDFVTRSFDGLNQEKLVLSANFMDLW